MKRKRNSYHTKHVLWEIWFQDMFDRECPREAVVSGEGLLKGLVELWSLYLYETIRENHSMGFSRFNLWLKQEGRSVEIVGDLDGAVKLREWVFEETRQRSGGNVELLERIAAAHINLMMKDETSFHILKTAKEMGSLREFESHLST